MPIRRVATSARSPVRRLLMRGRQPCVGGSPIRRHGDVARDRQPRRGSRRAPVGGDRQVFVDGFRGRPGIGALPTRSRASSRRRSTGPESIGSIEWTRPRTAVRPTQRDGMPCSAGRSIEWKESIDRPTVGREPPVPVVRPAKAAGVAGWFRPTRVTARPDQTPDHRPADRVPQPDRDLGSKTGSTGQVDWPANDRSMPYPWAGRRSSVWGDTN